MKIIKNTSHYNTKKLKSMFCFIHNQLAKHEGKLSWWSDLNIKIQHRQHCRSGRAFLKKTYRKDWDMFLSMSTEIDVEDIAQLFAHELMHNYGYKHHQFNRFPLTKKQVTQVQTKFTLENLTEENV